MSIRGRRPKPAAAKIAAGNPGKRKVSEVNDCSEIETCESVGKAQNVVPTFLDEEGQDTWNDLLPRLKKLRFVKSTDLGALARYCDYCSRWVKLKKDVDDRGETYETDSKHGKMTRANPSLNLMISIEKVLVSFEDRFGLTPAARQRQLHVMAGGNGELPLEDPPGEEHQADGSPIGLLENAAASNVLN